MKRWLLSPLIILVLTSLAFAGGEVLYNSQGLELFHTTQMAPTAKGTQGTTALPVQQYKDAGRNRIIFNADGVTGTASDTLITFNRDSGGTVASLTSHTVTAGKTFRVQSITVSMTDNSTTANRTVVRLREDPSSCTTTSAVLWSAELATNVTGTIAANEGYANVSAAIPDGLDIPSGKLLCLTSSGSAATDTVSVTVIGFEY